MPMKKTFTTLFLSVLMSAPLSAQDIVSSETENTIRDLFSASLQGERTCHSCPVMARFYA